MAKPTTNRWSKLSIWPGDGADPEDFTSKVCGLTSKGIAFSADTSDAVVGDCDDPDAPTWTERVTRSLSAGVNGSGLQADETFPFWNNWFLSGEAKNVRIVLDTAAPGYWQGRFLLTKYEVTGNQGDGKIQSSLSLVSDGPVTWANGAP
ncbi:hypothetical protein X566_15580 [Afipia sp. P52-10]|uniref:phage tail tube protein n=1 Tax=Afipia sp. P52-10 TaxID=1429916 RepID=UPI0003DF157C|nr:phage tail tube protein [Afipia sp. P52-10]ETR76013.1 hypothetical protein X566_15580 [Afipia sp. P52-10]